MLGKSLHRRVAKRACGDRAERGAAMAREHQPRGLVDEEVEKGVAGGGNSPTQAGLQRTLGFIAGKGIGLFEKIGVERHAVCARSDVERKRM